MNLRPIFVVAVAVVLLIAYPFDAVVAYQPPPKRSNEQLFGESVAVVHARVTDTRVVNLNQIGVPCDAVKCDILEIKLDVIETFKLSLGTIDKIYAAVPHMCSSSATITGWRYILFLVPFKPIADTVFASDYSHTIGMGSQFVDAGVFQMLADLRRLSADTGK